MAHPRKRERSASATRAGRRQPNHAGPLGDDEWGRRKLLALCALGVSGVLLVVVGIGLSVWFMLHPSHANSTAAAPVSTNGRGPLTTHQGTGVDADDLDAIAASPMPSVEPGAEHPGPLTTDPAPALTLPSGSTLGPAGVPTGFPHTPAGALSQMIAIDQAALQSASVPGAQAVITHWAAPGGPTAASWSGVQAVADLLSSAELPGTGSPSLTVTATPAMGPIKGTAGRNSAVGCVDFVVTAALATTARVATADCERMTWTPSTPGTPGLQSDRSAISGRWVIGPGTEPAPAPSVWPGTAAALAVGYQELRYE